MGDLQVEPPRVTKLPRVTTIPAQRVLVTGIGMVSPAGPDRESSWNGLREGARAARWLEPGEGLPASEEPSVPYAGAPAAWFPELPGRIDPVVSLALRAADEAIRDAALPLPFPSPQRAGCVAGTSKGGLSSFTAAWKARTSRPVDTLSCPDDWWNRFEPASAARHLAARYDLRGAALCPIAACATGTVSVARGADLIRAGQCDVVLAGSSDASLHPAVLASFRRLRVLARDFDDPAEACRPFDRRRDGFLIGEGAAVLVLEGLDHALARGAVPYAEWLADGAAADPAHLTQLDGDPTSLSRLIVDVLRRAGVAPDEIDYVNLHGTATRQNDLCETRAVKGALGTAARRASASSLKGTIGHLLGAAGSVELAATILALRDGTVPPTANLRAPDVECDLDYTPNVPQRRRLETALKLSLGFGGHLAAAVLRTWEGPVTRASSPPST